MHSAGPSQMNHQKRLFVLTSNFGRCWVVFGLHLGVMFGLFGGHVPTCLEDVCMHLRTLNHLKNDQEATKDHLK